MSFKKGDYYTVVERAKDTVPEFRNAYNQFIERVTIDQNSKSLAQSYSRNIAHVALHFGVIPQLVSAEEINSYLYRISVHEKKSEGYFKQTVYGLRYWFRLFGQGEKPCACLPSRKKKLFPWCFPKKNVKNFLKHREHSNTGFF